jgi:hypothetical protein
MLFAPLEGWRELTERRTSIDYAQVLNELSDLHFPKAEKIVLVQDNLKPTTPPHSTKHSRRWRPVASSSASNGTTRPSTAAGSIWPSPSLLSCPINVSIGVSPDRRSLKRQVAAWLLDRNTHNVKADWRFTAADARIKLKSLYPAL